MDSPWVHTGLGESAQLECVVQGNPQPQVRKVLQMKCAILPRRNFFSEYFSKLLHMYALIFDQCFIQSSTDIKDCWQRKPSFVCIFGKFYCFRAKVAFLLPFRANNPLLLHYSTTPIYCAAFFAPPPPCRLGVGRGEEECALSLPIGMEKGEKGGGGKEKSGAKTTAWLGEGRSGGLRMLSPSSLGRDERTK